MIEPGSRGRRVTIAVVVVLAVVLVSGFVVALDDAGVPMPVALVLVAGLVCLVAIATAGVVGYRASRREGRGVVPSMGRGLRTAVRVWWDLG
ncbi:MAG: hypothetical protein J7518_14655 [Nocardioidaceae bacterium]|nr:hypothetical protein [Nocardioidaceae bacterium]